MRIERELMRGAGPIAVLRLLEGGERYGYELVTLLEQRTKGVLAMGQSTLYPLLYNLEAKGLVSARIESSADNARPRKYYRLTDSGKKATRQRSRAVGITECGDDESRRRRRVRRRTNVIQTDVIQKSLGDEGPSGH